MRLDATGKPARAIGQLLFDEPLPPRCQCIANFAPKTGITHRARRARRQFAIDPGGRFNSDEVVHWTG